MISSVNGVTFNWSRIVFVGGSRIVSGPALFQKFQPIYDPKVAWAGSAVKKRQPIYWSGISIAPNTYIKWFSDTDLVTSGLIASGVVRADGLAGTSSMVGKTGAFIPTASLSGWLTSGSGPILSDGMILSEGLILSESGTSAVPAANDPSLIGEN
jgi:serine protease AprX